MEARLDAKIRLRDKDGGEDGGKDGGKVGGIQMFPKQRLRYRVFVVVSRALGSSTWVGDGLLLLLLPSPYLLDGGSPSSWVRHLSG